MRRTLRDDLGTPATSVGTVTLNNNGVVLAQNGAVPAGPPGGVRARPRSSGDPLSLDAALRTRMEALMRVEIRSGVPWLDTALTRVIDRGGKRIRPALLFAAWRCGAGGLAAGGRALLAGAAVELLHLASLVHDDVMDNAMIRGTEPTMQAAHGPQAALLGGDRLLAAGGRLAARAGADIALAWQDAYRDMCAGQARELDNRYRMAPVEQYLAAVRGKTASLVRASCLFGARCAGLPERQVSALAGFGDAFGMLFQLLDDLMDVVSTAELMGKPVRHDIGQGVYTLPVLLSARLPGSPLVELLRPDGPLEPAAAAYDAIRPEAIEATLTMLHGYADRAAEALAGVPCSPVRDALSGLPLRYLSGTLGRLVSAEYTELIANWCARAV